MSYANETLKLKLNLCCRSSRNWHIDLGAGITTLLITLFLASSPLYAQNEPPPDIALHTAVFQDNIEVVRQHIRAGSDLNEKDAFGSTPLVIAIVFGKTDVAQALIEAGADLSVSDNTGSAPLQLASFLGRTETVKALLDQGANRFLRNQSGSTAFDLVTAPFDEDIEIYDQLGAALAPLGLKLDYQQIKMSRPLIEKLLRPSPEELERIDYIPLNATEWKVSTPLAHDLDPTLVAELYLDASTMEKVYGLLVIKDGHLIAEKYFNEITTQQNSLVQSVSKSYISALVGIALEQGCLAGVDEKMMDFFPEFKDQIRDPRKHQITIRDLLQMRAGYPWEETDTALWNTFLAGDQLPMLVDVLLVNDPGSAFHYSNLSSYLLGVIVSRACGSDLHAYAQDHLLSPLGSSAGDWYRDKYENYYSFFGFTARDMARFGQLYLSDGRHRGKQIIPVQWVHNSLQSYSDDAGFLERGTSKVGRYFKDLGYGYQWWSAQVGPHDIDFAWGHGGQLIVLLDTLEMVIVLSADPQYLQHNAAAWRHEQANINLVGKFIMSLPWE